MAKAFFIKLGRAGAWEADCIARSIMRFGWTEQSCADINDGRWGVIEGQIRQAARSQGAATNDLNRLKDIASCAADDVWITFYQGKLWWTHVVPGPTESDDTSKFRRTQPWSDRSSTGVKLFASELPGKLSALQGFRGTICAVGDDTLLQNVISCEPTTLYRELREARRATETAVAAAIKRLHWKDFETLTDLVFRSAGWVRVGVLGETVKSFDLELREPITGDRYAVQVKSEATRQDLEGSLEGFDSNDYKRLFFVVHSPAASLAPPQSLPPFVDLVLPQRMSELVVDAGLLRWIEDRVT